MPLSSRKASSKGHLVESEKKTETTNSAMQKKSIVKKLKLRVSTHNIIPFSFPLLGTLDEDEDSASLANAIEDMNEILCGGGTASSNKSATEIRGSEGDVEVEREEGEVEEEEEEEEEDDDDESVTSHFNSSVLHSKHICNILASVSVSSGISDLMHSKSKRPKSTSSKESLKKPTNESLSTFQLNDDELDSEDTRLTESTDQSGVSSPPFCQSPIYPSSVADMSEFTSPKIDDKMNEYFEKDYHEEPTSEDPFNTSSYDIHSGTSSPIDLNLKRSVLENLNPNILNDTVFMKVNEKYEENPDDETLRKVNRLKSGIARKLQDTFELDDDDILYENFRGWLVSDILLQGHFFLTKNAVLFYSLIPNWYSSTSKKDYASYDPHRIIQSGSLGMKTVKYGDSMFNTIITHRYWAVLRRGSLCMYQSSTDSHFPTTIINLKKCLRAEIIENSSTNKGLSENDSKVNIPKLSKDSPDSDIYEAIEELGIDKEDIELNTGGVWFRIIGKDKSYKFYTDSIYLARQWCNNLTKIIFLFNNSSEDNEVIVKIPIDNLVDFKRTILFAGNEKEANESSNINPSVLSLKYLRNLEIHKGRNIAETEKIVKDALKRAKKDSLSNLLLDDIHFIFFSNGDKASKIFQDITFQHFGTADWSASDNAKLHKLNDERKKGHKSKNNLVQGISTLEFFKKSIIVTKMMSANPHLDPNAGINAIEKDKLFNFISIPKIFGSSKKSSEKVNLDSLTKPEVEHISATKPLELLSLPKTVSLSKLQNLQMSLEATRRDFSKLNLEELDEQRKRFNEKDMSTNSFIEDKIKLDEQKKPKQGRFKTIGRSLSALSNPSEFLSSPTHYEELNKTDDLYIKNDESRMSASRNFHNHFSLSTSNLIASYQVNLLRGIPVYGKLYIGEGELCFRSLLPGISTKMILPFIDIETCVQEKGSRLGCSGLVLVLKGMENIVLEFNFQKARNDCEVVILKQLEKVKLFYTIFDQTNLNQNYNEVSENLKVDKARMKLFEDRFCSVSGLDIPMILEDSPFFKIEVKTTISLKFTLLTIGSRGDVQPYIALGKALRKEGHQVTILTHGEFKDWILSHDLQFKEIAGNPVELMSLMVHHGSMSVGFLKEASAKFRIWIKELLSTSWEAAQGSDIIIESPSAMCGIHIAEALSIPYMRAFTMPWTRTRAYPHAFIVPEQNRGGTYNYMTHVMFETVFWKGISGQINKWRVELLGLPKTNLSKLKQTRVPFLYNVSPTIFPPAVDFFDWVKVTGYWFLDEGSAKGYEPPEDLSKFIDQARADNKKIVYIGFGSIVVDDAEALTKAVIEAVLKADVRCILNKGWSDRLSEVEKKPEVTLPPEIFNTAAVPHDWLFTKIDAAVHHGGSGSTGASMRAGLPTIIKPFFGDQFFYGTRIEAIGAGIALKKLDAKSLSKALVTVTTNEKMKETAGEVGRRIKDENGVLNAIECIYVELEYARTLILSKQKNTTNDTSSSLPSLP